MLEFLSLCLSAGEGLLDSLRRVTGVGAGELVGELRQVVLAVGTGSPLAGVLHAQAGDAREDAKRTLIEQAGRKEILMLLPLVFLILPLSVLFAVYPDSSSCVSASSERPRKERHEHTSTTERHSRLDPVARRRRGSGCVGLGVVTFATESAPWRLL